MPARRIITTTLCLLAIQIAAAESALPPEVQEAQTERLESIERANEAFREAVAKADADYEAALQRQMKKAMTDGDLDLALAIRELSQGLEQDNPASEPVDLGGDLLATAPGVDSSRTIHRRGEELTIKASGGADLGPMDNGDQVGVQYVAGTWKHFGSVGNLSPDDVGDNYINSRLAIVGVNGGTRQTLAVVPTGTTSTPFTYSVVGNWEQVLLRINDSDDRNPGEVRYRVWVEPARGGGAQPATVNLAGDEGPEVVIPRRLRWQALRDASPEGLGMLGPFPKGAVTDRALDFLYQGELGGEVLGVRPTRVVKDSEGKYFTSLQDNSDTFWFVYLRARSGQEEAAIKAVTREAHGRSDAPELYFDGRKIPNNAVLDIGSEGHLLIVRHPFNNGSGHNWLQLQITGGNLLYAP